VRSYSTADRGHCDLTDVLQEPVTCAVDCSGSLGHLNDRVGWSQSSYEKMKISVSLALFNEAYSAA
jgi:hypothetical protein